MDALETIYRQHFRFVWRSLRRLGVRDADLPDAVHDVFLVVQRKVAAFEGRSSVRTWLYAICMRTASDRRRSSRQVREVFGVSVELTADDDAGAASERRQALELLDELLD